MRFIVLMFEFCWHRWIVSALGMLAIGMSTVYGDSVPLDQRHWFETRTAHFNIYSCGSQQAVYKLAGRLEQFCKAYSQLAGSQAVDSPPIVVLAFPDHASVKPYLPLYHGRPGNIAAFFKRGSDENLIVLSLPETGSAYVGMEVIFHEYTHLLLRRNDQLWPVWLKEGMAEIYSTFETTGFAARIANPIAHHLRTLNHNRLMPLNELFAVTSVSPEYNEAERQGMFYAESWILTHFLMAGDNNKYRARFSQFTGLLRQGQLPVQAFTNALQTPLSVIQAELHRYLKQGVFRPIDLTLSVNISSPINLTTRPLPPGEVCFRLGDELLRVDQPDAAEVRFNEAKKLAPTSSLAEEGLGLLAHQRKEPDAAIRHLKAAIQLGSTSYLAYYICALDEFRSTADLAERYRRINRVQAAEIYGHLDQAINLMPTFGPAQQLCGILKMVQGEQMSDAEFHLQRAIQLEPENPWYVLSLAQYQYLTHNPTAARQTLEPLLFPNSDSKVRAAAEKMLQKNDRH